MYKIIKNKPAVKFYYRGSHSHAVKRTVLIIENTDKYIRGYELREGNITRLLKNAPIKSYIKSKTTKYIRNNNKNASLKRLNILDLLTFGV